MKKKSKTTHAVSLSLFDQPAPDDSPPRPEQPAVIADDEVEPFLAGAAPDHPPQYQEIPPDTLLTHLNDPQRQGVLATHGPVLILAGPGSGKTRVITHRIAYLIQQEHVKARNILAMTFTNKAAQEMRERLERMVGVHAQGVVITTFHALCARMLRRSHDFLLPSGLTATFGIADETDQERIIREVIGAPGIDLSGLEDNQKTPGALRDVISRAKSAMRTPDHLEAQAREENRFSLLLIAQVFREYNRLLRKHNLLDFEDLLLFTVKLLREEQAVRAYYQQKWTYLHVDEFQDTNTPQYLLLRLLALGTDEQPWGLRNVCVVGDDDQMIYTWRGASIKNFDAFEQDFPEARKIVLEQNYRTTALIVQAASAVVQQNRQRRAKQLWTANDQGDPVLLVETETEDEEASFVFATIEQLRRSGAIAAWSEVAVLSRTNAQSRALEEAALEAEIPYQMVGSLLFYQRKEVKDFLAFLRVLVNEHDALSLERIINVPPRGIGKRTLGELKEWAESRGFSLVEALSRLHEGTTLPRPARQALASFARLLHQLRQATETCLLPDLLDQVGRLTGFEQTLKGGTEDQQERWANIEALKRVASRFAGTATPRALLLFLEHVSLMSGADHAEADHQPLARAERDAVTLLTLHSAKGLEYPVVFLIGVEEGFLPHARTFLEDIEEGSLEEERRLMYVGMTRAKRRLYCTWTTRRFAFGKPVRPSPSRFLHAIPSHCRQVLAESGRSDR